MKNVDMYNNSKKIDEAKFALLNTTMKSAISEEDIAKECLTHVLSLYLGVSLGNGVISISSLNVQVLLNRYLKSPSLDATQKAEHDVTLLKCYLLLGDLGMAESHGELVLESLSSGSQTREVQGLPSLLAQMYTYLSWLQLI